MAVMLLFTVLYLRVLRSESALAER